MIKDKDVQMKWSFGGSPPWIVELVRDGVWWTLEHDGRTYWALTFLSGVWALLRTGIGEEFENVRFETVGCGSCDGQNDGKKAALELLQKVMEGEYVPPVVPTLSYVERA